MDGTTYTDREDSVLAAEIRAELKRRGYVGFIMKSEDLTLYLMWFLGILLGLTLAAGRQ